MRKIFDLQTLMNKCAADHDSQLFVLSVMNTWGVKCDGKEVIDGKIYHDEFGYISVMPEWCIGDSFKTVYIVGDLPITITDKEYQELFSPEQIIRLENNEEIDWKDPTPFGHVHKVRLVTQNSI